MLNNSYMRATCVGCKRKERLGIGKENLNHLRQYPLVLHLALFACDNLNPTFFQDRYGKYSVTKYLNS